MRALTVSGKMTELIKTREKQRELNTGFQQKLFYVRKLQLLATNTEIKMMIKNNWILFTQKRKINGKAGYERVSKFQRKFSQFSPFTGLALEPVVPIEWLMQCTFARRCRWLAGLLDCWRSTRPSTSNRGTCFACAGCGAMCSGVWGSDSRWMVSWGRHVPCKMTENQKTLFNRFRLSTIHELT